MGFDEPITIWEISGFNARVDEILPQSDTMREAYKAVESEVFAAYNRHKYRNYESFYQARRRWLRERSKSNRWNKKPGFSRAA
jgi:hypothetical protein